MADPERKELVWTIRKDLHRLTANELYQLAENIGQVPDRNLYELDKNNEESCLEYVYGHVCSKALLDQEDQGVAQLLFLKDLIHDLIANREKSTEIIQPTKEIEGLNENQQMPSLPIDLAGDATEISHGVELQQMLASYEELGRKLEQYKTTTATLTTVRPTTRERTSMDSSPSNEHYQHTRSENTELMCAKQYDHETPQQFLYRMIGLKQKIIFASRQADTDIRYDNTTVQGVFLHTIYQGLGTKHNDIRRDLKPLLSDVAVSDEALLRHVIKITSEESERQRRLGQVSRNKMAHAHSAQLEGNAEKLGKEVVDSKRTCRTMEELSAQVAALSSMIDTLKNSQQSGHSCQCNTSTLQTLKKESHRVCPNCVKQGTTNCNHCFACGEEGHRAVGCLKSPGKSGNGSRSLRRDKQ
ncbi:hypothetical protein HHUSO_G23929 [Huso huso]|uniref:CCHC-type domain-containing protein n=1 Tax=Huso huso TaxID=61971 RepID=A0ABR0YTK3_HUSHU